MKLELAAADTVCDKCGCGIYRYDEVLYTDFDLNAFCPKFAS